MPNTESQYNPAYSTVKAIFLSKNISNLEVDLNIIRYNTECQFEKIEFVENINEVFPSGVLIVRDTKDIVSYIRNNLINKIIVEFFDSKKWELIITSVSYLNNAASDSEENFIGIYFSNKYYQLVHEETLYSKLKFTKPNVYYIHDFVNLLKKDYFSGVSGSGVSGASGYIDKTSNYVLYRPLNTIHGREEIISDNGIQYLNYLANYAIDEKTKIPSYMFWTDFSGNVNFKSFNYNIQEDSSFASIDEDSRRLAVYDGDSVLQPVSEDVDKLYRKISFLSTNPVYQYISKNYYYIRKTPKVLDVVPTGLCGSNLPTNPIIPPDGPPPSGSDNWSDFGANAGDGNWWEWNNRPGGCGGSSLTNELLAYNYKNMAYQFQDEGERFNIELISSGLSGNSYYLIPGSEQLVYQNSYGYYDGDEPIDTETPISHMSQVFGTQKAYATLDFVGVTNYMSYVDNTEMWKNCFDLTAIHPNFPDGGTAVGSDTNLQKVINARYNAFIDGVCGAEKELEQIRKIELQNFVMYSLCCMGQEDCFFAVLQRYEVDNTQTPTGTNAYRYKWNKISYIDSFTGPSGSCGACGASGASGSTYHHLEKWTLEGAKSSDIQDETWAINLNERGLTSGYYPPGWADCLPSNFKYRPIGAKGNSTSVGTGGTAFHIVRLCKQIENGKSFYYFTAENVVDGCCD